MGSNKINQTKLSEQQKTILGWLYVAESSSNWPPDNWPFEPKIGLRPLRGVCIPLHRRRLWRKGANLLRYSLRTLENPYYVTHSESASFSRSIRRLEERALIETKKGLRKARPGDRPIIKGSAPWKVVLLTPSTQRDTVKLTEKGSKIAEQMLTRKMKYRITVNKKLRSQ